MNMVDLRSPTPNLAFNSWQIHWPVFQTLSFVDNIFWQQMEKYWRINKTQQCSLKKTIAPQCLGEFCLFFKVIPFCLSAPFAATLIHSFVNKKNFQPRSFSLNNILSFSSFCGFMSTRILPYFALSVLRSSSVTDNTSQLLSIILWLRPWTSFIFWLHIF